MHNLPCRQIRQQGLVRVARTSFKCSFLVQKDESENLNCICVLVPANEPLDQYVLSHMLGKIHHLLDDAIPEFQLGICT